MDMTLSQKQALQSIVEAGAEVATVVYNPNTVDGDPEAAAVSAGWTEFTRASSANIEEVIYTR